MPDVWIKNTETGEVSSASEAGAAHLADLGGYELLGPDSVPGDDSTVPADPDQDETVQDDQGEPDEAAQVREVDAHDDAEAAEVADLSTLTNNDLRALAADRGLDVAARATKAELLDALQGG